MRLLKLNGAQVDIDEKTAIGITFQAYDFSDPGKRKLKLSNSFSIPLTIKNQRAIGFANNVQSTSTEVYDSFACDYFIDNEHLIKSARVRISEISDRIKLHVFEKKSVWDEMRELLWIDFESEFLEFLRTEKGVYAITNDGVTYYTGTYSQFISQYVSTTGGLIIPYFFGNLFNSEIALEDESNIYITNSNRNGGHVCAFAKTIFEFIEHKYSVDFNTGSTDTSLIWQDQYAPNIYIPLRSYVPANFEIATQWGFKRETGFILPFAPYEDLTERADLTLYDFVTAFMQLFNVILDESEAGGILNVKMYRFDDIKTKAEVIPFSGKIDLSKTIFKPYIPGYEQKNRIKYDKTYPGGNEFEGAKEIVCNNKNLEPLKELFTIKAYYPNVVKNSDDEYVLNLSTEESFEPFVFLISTGDTSNNVNLRYFAENYSTKLKIAAVYGISGEYSFIDEILAYPKFYEIQKWLSISDIANLKFFAQYHVKELNGSFFINKISGFNPDKSKTPTKVELIRISDKVPKPVDDYLESFWTDGLGNAFVDGIGNNFV